MTSLPEGYIVVPVWSDDGDVKALVDDDGYLPVKEGTPLTQLNVILTSSQITLPVEEKAPLTSIQAQVYGWVASAWKKIAMSWGYSAQLFESFDAVATGGSWGKYSTAVPTGEVHVVQAITIRNETRSPGRTEFLIYDENNDYFHLEWVASLARYEPLKWVGHITLAYDWQIRILMDGTAADDVIAGGVAGYKMDIAE